MKFYERFRNKKVQVMANIDIKRSCVYPIGDPQSKNFKFCCDPVENNRFVYCDNHAKLCYLNYEQIKNRPRGNTKRRS